MFDNIGRKLKIAASLISRFGIILSIIEAIAYLFLSKNLSLGILIVPLIIIVGLLITWITSAAIYGLGQLIENTDTIVSQQKELITLSKISKIS